MTRRLAVAADLRKDTFDWAAILEQLHGIRALTVRQPEQARSVRRGHKDRHVLAEVSEVEDDPQVITGRALAGEEAGEHG